MWWWLGAALAGAVGWRGDGTGVYPGAYAPVAVSPERARWSAEVPLGFGSSPVVAGDRLVLTAEPCLLLGLDARTGARLWELRSEWIDSVPPERRAAAEAELAEGRRATERLTAVQREYSSLQREARRGGGDGASLARLEALSLQMGELQVQADRIRPYTTWSRDVLGWANPTPVVDGDTVYAAFANGVVTAASLDGQRRWSVWLGPQAWSMRGYHEGSTASPLLVDGALIIPYGALHALDPATGRLRWSSGVYHDFGTPTVATVGGRRYLVTPDGRAVDPRTGADMARGLGNVWYGGPVADGDTVYYLGGTLDEETSRVGGVQATAVQLVPSGSGLTARTRWTTDVPLVDRFYAAPVVHDGLLYQVSKKRTLLALDTATGAIVYQQSLDPFIEAGTWTNPQVVGDHLAVLTLAGDLLYVPLGRTFRVAAQGRMGLESGGQPAWSDGRMWLRTGTRVWSF